jgi:hypothetical protein
MLFICFRLFGAPLIAMLTIVSASGQSTRSAKIIKLSGYTDKYSVSFDYDSAIVSLGLSDVREHLAKLKAKKSFSSIEFQKYFTETLNAINTDKDYTFKNTDIFSSAGIIEQYTLRAIVSKGKAKVLNKRTQQFVTRIKRTYYRHTTAGERHEGYEFAFMDETIFLIDRISI